MSNLFKKYFKALCIWMYIWFVFGEQYLYVPSNGIAWESSTPGHQSLDLGMYNDAPSECW